MLIRLVISSVLFQSGQPVATRGQVAGFRIFRAWPWVRLVAAFSRIAFILFGATFVDMATDRMGLSWMENRKAALGGCCDW